MTPKQLWIKAIKAKIANYKSDEPTYGESYNCPMCRVCDYTCYQCIMAHVTYHLPCIRMKTYPANADVDTRLKFWEAALPIMEALPDDRFDIKTGDYMLEDRTVFPELWELDNTIINQTNES